MSTNGKVVFIDADRPKLDLIQVQTHEMLLAYWPFVKKGIEHIKKRDKSCGSWTPNQIFNAIRFGLPTAQPKTTAVELFLAVEEMHKPNGTSVQIPKAFMVTQPKIDPFRNNVPCGIIVWLLYADYGMIEKFLPSLEYLCKLNGGDQIEFWSGRQGWLRHFGRMARLGFKIQQYKYVKDVSW